MSTAVFFGLIPVIGGLRQDVNEALRSGGREHSGFRRTHLRNLLIVGEVAISVILLTAAGILMHSFLREREVRLGLNPQHLLTAQVFLTKGHRTLEQKAQFNRDLTAVLRGVPGVLEVAITTDFLPFGGASTEFAIQGKPHSGQYEGQFAMISPALFRLLRVPLLRGRNLTDIDLLDKDRVALVNQAFVDKFYRHEDPIGELVQVTTLACLPEPLRNPIFEIVGVTGNFKNRGLRQPVLPEAFIPYTVSGLGGFSLLVRTIGDPQALARSVEGKALTLDSSAAVRHLRTMEEGLENEEYAKPRFGLEIFSVFALLGVLLVSAGLYSIMFYTVSQRRREMGIRMALGAKASEVQWMVIGTGMRFVTYGLVFGLFASLLSLRFLQNQIWGVPAHDPVTLAATMAILALVGLAACFLPSLTVTQLDPASVLRSE